MHTIFIKCYTMICALSLTCFVTQVTHAAQFSCPRSGCNQQFAKQSLFREHIQQGHGRTKQEIAQYMMIDSHRSGIKQLTCPDCHEIFDRRNRGNLVRHLLKFHHINAFYCMHNDCLKSFDHYQKLKQHMLQGNHDQKRLIQAQPSTPSITHETPVAPIQAVVLSSQSPTTRSPLDISNIYYTFDQVPLRINTGDTSNFISDADLFLNGQMDEMDVVSDE